MTPVDPQSDSREERARRALRDLPSPQARPEFREQLRAEFTSGDIAARVPKVVVHRFPRTMRIAAIAAGIVLLAGFTFTRLNRSPAWQIVATQGQGMVLIDGRPVALEDREALTAQLRGGARVQIPESAELDLVCNGRLLLQLTPGTVMTIPSPPGRWIQQRSAMQFEAGEARVATGPLFKGAELLIRTPEAETRVRGTTMAVIRTPGSTCVCAFEGDVTVAAPGETAQPVAAGTRRFLYADGRPPEVLAIDDMEASKLGMLLDRSREILAPAAPRP